MDNVSVKCTYMKMICTVSEGNRAVYSERASAKLQQHIPDVFCPYVCTFQQQTVFTPKPGDQIVFQLSKLHRVGDIGVFRTLVLQMSKCNIYKNLNFILHTMCQIVKCVFVLLVTNTHFLSVYLFTSKRS